MQDELRKLAEFTVSDQDLARTGGKRDGSGSQIMVVDDEPANLKLLEELLQGQGYTVRSFPRGRLALDAVARTTPDLILLDINMPEMDGFEVCRLLKADPKLATIPVLFLSALNQTSDKVRAFEAGGIDYITKPFQLEEVRARVETHLQLRHARQAERDLLENTLNSAVKALSELANLMSPAITHRSAAIRGMVVHMATKLGLPDRWQYELAAVLSLVGCITLPPDVFERAYAGEDATPEELRMYRAHPDVGFLLLSRIPRLEQVAMMIRLQQVESDSDNYDQVAWGALMLRIAQELDRRTLRGIPFRIACDQVCADGPRYSCEMIGTLNDFSPSEMNYEVQRLSPMQLKPGMILEDDVITEQGGFTVIAKGAGLTLTLVERIQNFDRTRGVRGPIQVRVPQGVYADRPETVVA